MNVGPVYSSVNWRIYVTIYSTVNRRIYRPNRGIYWFRTATLILSPCAQHWASSLRIVTRQSLKHRHRPPRRRCPPCHRCPLACHCPLALLARHSPFFSPHPNPPPPLPVRPPCAAAALAPPPLISSDRWVPPRASYGKRSAAPRRLHPCRCHLHPGRAPLHVSHHWCRPAPLSQPPRSLVPLWHRPSPMSRPTTVCFLPSRSLDPWCWCPGPQRRPPGQWRWPPASGLYPTKVFLILYWIWVKFGWK
jgi:hypothetical protein